MDFLSRDVAEAVAVRVKADRGVEAGFATGPADADVAAACGVFGVGGGVVESFDAAEDLAFPVPATFADADVGAGHAEALFCCDASAGEVEKDMGGGIFEVEAGAVGLGFGLAVVLGGGEGWVGYAMDVAEAFAVVDTMAL